MTESNKHSSLVWNKLNMTRLLWYLVCHKLFGLFWTKSIQKVSEYQIFEPSKLFIFHCKYLYKDWTNNVSFITAFSTLNEEFIIFITKFCKFWTNWEKFERYRVLKYKPIWGKNEIFFGAKIWNILNLIIKFFLNSSMTSYFLKVGYFVNFDFFMIIETMGGSKGVSKKKTDWPTLRDNFLLSCLNIFYLL